MSTLTLEEARNQLDVLNSKRRAKLITEVVYRNKREEILTSITRPKDGHGRTTRQSLRALPIKVFPYDGEVEDESVFTAEDCSSHHDSSLEEEEEDAFAQFNRVAVDCSALKSVDPFTNKKKNVIYFDFSGLPGTEAPLNSNKNVI